jgi:hypothetical protein
MKPLSGVDGALLHLETTETPTHVASLHLFDLPAGYRGDFHANIKRQMRQRLRLAPVFTRKLAPMPLQFANPVWDGFGLHDGAQRGAGRAQALGGADGCAGRIGGQESTSSAQETNSSAQCGLDKRTVLNGIDPCAS